MRQLNSFMYLEKDYLSHTHWGNYTHPYWMWYLELIRLIVKDVKLKPNDLNGEWLWNHDF